MRAAWRGGIVLILQAIKFKHPEYSVRIPDVETMVASAAVMGALIGYWFPNSTRSVAERVPERGNQKLLSASSVSS